MKKMILFLLVVSCLCCPFILGEKCVFSLPEIDYVCFVSEEEIDGAYDKVFSGNKIFSYCTLEEAKKVYLSQKIDAVELFFEKFDLKTIEKKLDLQVVSIEEFEGLKVILGYTPCYKDCVYVDGKKVNVQLAVYDDKMIAGFPMILTGY